MKRYCLTLDLKDDPVAIKEYEAHHQRVWPEVIQSIAGSGIQSMEIYRRETRLVLFMETVDDFSFEDKARADNNNSKVQEWEELMWRYQQPLKGAAKGEKWMLMNKIFDLADY
jgi:L-rhamnose mutarotase